MRTRLLRHQKKRPVVLLEILIALSLTGILLTFLFSFFAESVKIEKKLDQARMAVTSRAYVQTRLQSILSSIHSDSPEASALYTKYVDGENQLSLITIFDNGIDPDPLFSGSVIGRLYIDKDHNLSLTTWPLTKSKNPPWRKEILLSHIKSFDLEFLGDASAPEDKNREKIRPITPNYAWRSHHHPSETLIPSMIRLTLQEEKSKGPLRFAFLLASTEPRVRYREGAQ